MTVFAFICILLEVLVLTVAFSFDLNATCNKLRTDSHFDIYQLVGKQWRVYYSWDLYQDMNHKCSDLTFRNATPIITNRIWNDMHEYLTIQPQWSAAVLLMSTQPSQEMLLFPYQNTPGKFIGVANVVRAVGASPLEKSSVPLFKIHMKLLEDGRYLIVSDCNVGVTTLSVWVDLLPVKGEMEILEVAATLDLGKGRIICTVEPFLEGK